MLRYRWLAWYVQCHVHPVNYTLCMHKSCTLQLLPHLLHAMAQQVHLRERLGGMNTVVEENW